MTQNFTVPGVPVARASPKSMYFGKMTGTFDPSKLRKYDPKRSRDWKAFCATIAIEAKIRPHAGAVKVVIDAVFTRPKNTPKWMGKGRVPRASRPDCDNLAKNLGDALNGIAYEDDAAIVTSIVNKWVAAEGEMPGVHVEISDVEVPKNPKEKA